MSAYGRFSGGSTATRIQTAIIAGFVIVIGLGVLVASQRSAPSDETTQVSAGGGSGDGERTIDTSPFKPAEPESEGATTLPDGFFEGQDGIPTTTSAGTPSTTTPTKSADRPPESLLFNQPQPGQPVCGLYRMVLSFQTMIGPTFKEQMTQFGTGDNSTANQMRRALDAYVASTNGQMAKEVQVIRDTLFTVLDAVERGNYDINDPSVSGAMQAAAESDDYLGFRAAFTRVGDYEREHCP